MFWVSFLIFYVISVFQLTKQKEVFMKSAAYSWKPSVSIA